jgi:hypothetical protein
MVFTMVKIECYPESPAVPFGHNKASVIINRNSQGTVQERRVEFKVAPRVKNVTVRKEVRLERNAGRMNRVLYEPNALCPSVAGLRHVLRDAVLCTAEIPLLAFTERKD